MDEKGSVDETMASKKMHTIPLDAKRGKKKKEKKQKKIKFEEWKKKKKTKNEV